jgi:hypothetical protein
MASKVFANMMEISCKAGAGKGICAFPDVCFTPPQTPATPPGVPIPYPNTGMDSDTSDGSRTVKISGQEAMLKNKSFFKKSIGDEAGCAPKKNVITSKNGGKVYFAMWSMDVKIEGENAVRNLDIATHNHGSTPGGTPPWPFTAGMTPAEIESCKGDKEKEKAACSDKETGNYKSAQACCDDPECQKARNCMLLPYGGSGSPNCCTGKTGHHILPNSLLQATRDDSSTNVSGLKKTGSNAYTCDGGACVCVTGESHSSGDHGVIHDKTKTKLRGIMEAGGDLTYEVAKSKCAEAHAETFPGPNGEPQCSKACIEAQIDASLRPSKTGGEIQVREKDGMTSKNFDRFKTGKAK